MPIVDITLVGPVPPGLRPGLASRIADAVAQVLDARPQGTWVKLHFLPSDAYGENAGGPPPGAQPVLASILQAHLPQPAELSEQVAALTDALAEVCQRPVENIHLIFEPSAAGRIAFGGTLRT